MTLARTRHGQADLRGQRAVVPRVAEGAVLDRCAVAVQIVGLLAVGRPMVGLLAVGLLAVGRLAEAVLSVSAVVPAGRRVLALRGLAAGVALGQVSRKTGGPRGRVPGRTRGETAPGPCGQLAGLAMVRARPAGAGHGQVRTASPGRVAPGAARPLAVTTSARVTGRGTRGRAPAPEMVAKAEAHARREPVTGARREMRRAGRTSSHGSQSADRGPRSGARAGQQAAARVSPSVESVARQTASAAGRRDQRAVRPEATIRCGVVRRGEGMTRGAAVPRDEGMTRGGTVRRRVAVVRRVAVRRGEAVVTHGEMSRARAVSQDGAMTGRAAVRRGGAMTRGAAVRHVTALRRVIVILAGVAHSGETAQSREAAIRRGLATCGALAPRAVTGGRVALGGVVVSREAMDSRDLLGLVRPGRELRVLGRRAGGMPQAGAEPGAGVPGGVSRDRVPSMAVSDGQMVMATADRGRWQGGAKTITPGRSHACHRCRPASRRTSSIRTPGLSSGPCLATWPTRWHVTSWQPGPKKTRNAAMSTPWRPGSSPLGWA